LPVKTRKADPDNGEWMLARADSAGWTHSFIDALGERAIEFSLGFPMDEAVREAVLALDGTAWRPAIAQDSQLPCHVLAYNAAWPASCSWPVTCWP